MAAAAVSESTKKLELLLECPICLKTLAQPKIFHCLHFFCAPCIGGLKPKTIDLEQCYECPKCRQETPIHKLRPMYFIHDLLEIMALAKKGQLRCDKCKDEDATHRCLDCKENFGAVCRAQHLGFSILQHHTWQELSEADQPILDKHIHCESHKGEIVRFHCKDCDQLICLLCNGTDHKLHKAETIDEAITNLLPLVKKRTEDVKTQITAKKRAINDVQAQKTAIRKQYDDIDGQIESRYEAIVERARNDRHRAKEDLAIRKHKHITVIEKLEKNMEEQVKFKENIVALNDAALISTQGPRLLQAMKGIVKNLESHIRQVNTPDISDDVRVYFEPVLDGQENVVGVITDKESKLNPAGEEIEHEACTATGAGDGQECSRIISQRLSDVTNRTAKLQKTIGTKTSGRKLTKVGNKIWLVKWKSNVCDMYLKDKTQYISFANIGNCRALVKVNCGLVVASSQGLHLTTFTGVVTETLLRGDFVDVALRGKTLYALNNGDGTIEVLTLDQSGTSITDVTAFEIKNYNKSWGLNTIQITSQFLYVIVRFNHVILRYSHDGTLLSELGSEGASVDQLKRPRLCGADQEGTLLIADEWNHSIKTLTSEGTWNCLNIDGLQEPIDAIMENDKLIVLQLNGELKQYSIQE